MVLENFEFGKEEIAAIAIIFLTTILWASFLGLSGIAANDFFTFKIDIVAEKLMNLNTALFFFALPLPIVAMAAFAKRCDKASLMIFSFISSLLGLLIAMFIFPNLQGLLLLALFYLVSIPLVIEVAVTKKTELKKWVAPRTMLSSMGKTITLLSIGFVVLSALTILPIQDEYIGKFEGMIEGFAAELTTGNSQSTISSEATDLFVNSQIATVDTILENPVFEKLRQKQDLDVMAFVLLADQAKDSLNSDEYRQQVEEKFRQSSSSIAQNIDIMEMIKKQFPWFELLERYLWLFHALAIIGIFSLIANIICKPMAAVYGSIAETAAKTLLPEKPKAGTQKELNK